MLYEIRTDTDPVWFLEVRSHGEAPANGPRATVIVTVPQAIRQPHENNDPAWIARLAMQIKEIPCSYSDVYPRNMTVHQRIAHGQDVGAVPTEPGIYVLHGLHAGTLTVLVPPEATHPVSIRNTRDRVWRDTVVSAPWERLLEVLIRARALPTRHDVDVIWRQIFARA